MAVMNMIQALNSAHDVMMGRDDNIVVMGEDVGFFGGVFRVTEGLQKKYGKNRVFDTPIAENGIVATAIGMAAYGLRPVAEIQFADYIYPAYDQIVSEAARLRYRTAGEWNVPMVIRSPYGGGIFGGQTHSQSVEALFAHVAGVKTVIPSTPYDAKGLLIAAIEDNDPVLFFEPKRIYNGPFDGFFDRPLTPWAKHPASEVPEDYYRIEIGKAAVVREGDVEAVGGGRGPGGMRIQQERRRQQDGVVQIRDQLADGDLLAVHVGDREQVQRPDQHPPFAAQVRIAAEHRHH